MDCLIFQELILDKLLKMKKITSKWKIRIKKVKAYNNRAKEYFEK